MAKHIFITGGVVSSLGKGITAASIGMLLKSRGYSVALQKLDPYLNVDPGTMSPFQHGEVYVTDDGAETDLDLGHYERFAGVDCTRKSNHTTGSIYSRIITREREGGYLGRTVQVIPHVTDEIKRAIYALEADGAEIAITEIGGTAGDIESLPFLEAIRQFRWEAGAGNAIFIHLTLVPYIKAAGEMKTKPSQQSVSILRGIGIIPDILVCRCERPMSADHMAKLSLFCNVRKDLVFEERDVANTIYEVPIELSRQRLDESILKLLGLPANPPDLSAWSAFVERVVSPRSGMARVAVVGKYASLRDSYKSIFESLVHAGAANDIRVETHVVEAEELERQTAAAALKDCDGLLIPGGFGERGIKGKIEAIRHARERGVPFFGICLGMQCAVIEFARHVLGMAGADSTEFTPDTPHPVIDLMEEQKNVSAKGGTMRLGAYPCAVAEGSKAREAYGVERVSERHRHRFEFNSAMRPLFEAHGMAVTGVNPGTGLAEIVEIPGHPWFVGCQFHPEFKSRPLAPHPLFTRFVAAAAAHRRSLPSY